jgi:hypothetical protein
MVGVEMIQEFYYGTSWKWPIQYLPRVMLSANVIKKLKSTWIMPERWMMDSGIGGMFKGKKRDLSIDEYALVLQKWHPPIAWSYDWPCEPGLRNTFHYSVKQAQDWTTENTIWLLENYPVSSVIQGWDVDDYLRHIDDLKSHGLLTERMGIGSICRRGQINKISRIIREIHRELPSWVKLHGFGVKISILNTDAFHCLFSADSASWNMERRYYSWNENNNKGLTWQQKVPWLLSYIDRIESLIAPHPEQTLLEVEE